MIDTASHAGAWARAIRDGRIPITEYVATRPYLSDAVRAALNAGECADWLGRQHGEGKRVRGSYQHHSGVNSHG